MNTVKINALLSTIVLIAAGFTLLNSRNSAEITDIPWLMIGVLIAASLLAGVIFKRKGAQRPAEVAKNKKHKRNYT